MQFTCVYCFRFVSVRNLLLNFLQSCGSFFRTLSFRTYSFRIFRVALLFICQGACFDLIEVFVRQSFEDYQRRRRDLNPRAAINDLLPFQGSPFSLLGTSPDKLAKKKKRRGWDSNPRALADKRFSRPPRYDRFDTSPCRILAVSLSRRKCYSNRVIF